MARKRGSIGPRFFLIKIKTIIANNFMCRDAKKNIENINSLFTDE